jgi:3-carboxy-cis,cis-muconate cycloisomerase
MISPFEHPFLSGLLGDAETAALLGIEAELAAMLRFEAALAEAEAELGIISPQAGAAIAAALAAFRPDLDELKAGTARDGVVVPDLVRQIRRAVGEPYASQVHLGATSQDVVDTALILRVQACLDLFQTRLEAATGLLDGLKRRFGHNMLMGRTRMQAAIPITVADRIESWRAPIVRHLQRLDGLRPGLRVVQFGGAAGTLDRFGDAGSRVRAALAARLGLADCPQWHSQRDRIADVANWLSLVTGSLGKLGQDIAMMKLAGGEISLKAEGGSSAMPHKQNPIAAETLVSLARYNAVQVSAMHHGLLHEQERSGSAWTLEWLVLPQILMAAGAAMQLSIRLLGDIGEIGRNGRPETSSGNAARE